MEMMKPITKKVLFGLPAVVLTAALACTMVGCGGGSTDGTQGESGGEAPAEQKAYESQKVEVMGFTIESLADGTYYRGDVYKQDGFYLRVKITNNNEKAKQKTTVGAIAAFGELEATDPSFHGSAKGLLSFDLNKPEGLSEGAQIEGDPTIEPGESIEWVYFWDTKDNYYGPISVGFFGNVATNENCGVMHFDTTDGMTDEMKAANAEAEAIAAKGGVDYSAYSVTAAKGWALVETNDDRGSAVFNPDGSTKRFQTKIMSREPLAEAEAIQGNYSGKGVLDEVDVKGVTWTRYTAETGTVYMYAKAPCGKTVHMFFDNGITWDDALPMMENVVLK